MATGESNEYSSVVQVVSKWPTELKIELANNLLRSCQSESQTTAPRGISAEEAARLFGSTSQQDAESYYRDEDTEALEEALLEKYGK